MLTMPDDDDWLRPLLGQLVVLDLDGDYLAFGRLEAVGRHHLTLVEADLHDHSEANCTKEVYALESKQIGVRVNRAVLHVPRSRLIAVSRLEDC